MKKIIFLATIVAVLMAGFVSCKQKSKPTRPDSVAIDEAHSSRNSLEWQGSYEGIIPCADCEGISVRIVLNLDETYQANYLYLGKNDNTPETFSGKFSWNDLGSAITLDRKEFASRYKVGENKLIQLDLEGNPITGELADMYILNKVY